MRLSRKVIPTDEPAFDEEQSDSIEQGGPEEEDSGRGLLLAVNKHVYNEDDEGNGDEDEEDSDGAPKQRGYSLAE